MTDAKAELFAQIDALILHYMATQDPTEDDWETLRLLIKELAACA